MGGLKSVGKSRYVTSNCVISLISNSLKEDYKLADKFAFYFRDDLGFTWEQIETFIQDFMQFAESCHGKTMTYEDFSKHFARFNYQPVDEKEFMLVVQALSGEKLFTEH